MRINNKVVSDKFDDEVVVVSLETGAYYSFKSSSADIWSLLERKPSQSTILKMFAGISSDQENAINFFIEFLVQEGLVVNDESEKADEVTPNSIEYSKIEYSKFDDMADLIMIDPIHEADDKKGWPDKA